MNKESDYIRVIFGLKLKQSRQRKKMSLQDLANLTGVSKSYLNEIENGKKFPKHDKIIQLSEALNCSYDELVSTKLDKALAPVSEILKNDFFKELPLELFGIDKSHLISIISDAPKKVTAFINTLIEISKNYNLSKERFYFAVVRSFQELYDNYFPDIEEKAQACINTYNLGVKSTADDFEKILTENFQYSIQHEDFKKYGTTGKLRSLYIPEKKILFLNQLLDEDQKIFILAKELGYSILNLNPRPHTYSWLDFTNFEELLNNYYSSYFAGCMLIPRIDLKQKINHFFQNTSWESEEFENIIESFTNSPETFYYRLTNILPQDFGIKDLFYLCFTKKKNSDRVDILKELHLNQLQAPHANATNEHYCRRWIAIKNLTALKDDEQKTEAQISHYKDSGATYLVISTSQKNPFSDGTNRSYCLGILLNTNTLKKINFAKSDKVKTVNVGVTCEICSILDCEVRQAPPVRLEKERANEAMKNAITSIRKEVLK